MILQESGSISILGKLEKLLSEPCPWQFERIKPWCERAVKAVLCHSVMKLKVDNLFFDKLEKKTFVGKKTKRKTPLWLDKPSSFFPQHTHVQNKYIDVETCGMTFYQLENVYVFNFYGWGPIVLTENYEVIPQLSTPFYPLLALDSNGLPAAVKPINDNVIAISDRFSEPNYAHWLLDSMPRLQSTQLFYSDERKVLCYEPVAEWQKSMLKEFGVDMQEVLPFAEGVGYKFAKIVVSSDFGCAVNHPMNKANHQTVEFLSSKRILTKEFELDVLIVSREKTRVLVNENVLALSLKNKGFSVKCVDTSKISVTEQIALFSSAKFVIGVHGAALANSIFMSPQSHLIELLPDSFCNPAFWITSSANKVNYVGVTNLIEVDVVNRPCNRNVKLKKESIDTISSYCRDNNALMRASN